jgi:hypothetical protein
MYCPRRDIQLSSWYISFLLLTSHDVVEGVRDTVQGSEEVVTVCL